MKLLLFKLSIFKVVLLSLFVSLSTTYVCGVSVNFSANPGVVHVGSLVNFTVEALADDSSGTITNEFSASKGFTFVGVVSITNGTYTPGYPAGTWVIPGPVSVLPYNSAGTIVLQYVVNEAILTDADHIIGGSITQVGSSGSEGYGHLFNVFNAILGATITTNSVEPVLLGDEFDITLTVVNSGTEASPAQTVITLPAGLTFLSSSVTQGSYDSGTNTWTMGSLTASPYGSATLVLHVSVNGNAPSGGTLDVSAQTTGPGNDITSSLSILVGDIINAVTAPSFLFWDITAPSGVCDIVVQ